MRKIDAIVLEKLNLGDLVFKYPVSTCKVENDLDPEFNKDSEKYMLIAIDHDGVQLEFAPPRKNSVANLYIKKNDFFDGTWWTPPEKMRISY